MKSKKEVGRLRGHLSILRFDNSQLQHVCGFSKLFFKPSNTDAATSPQGLAGNNAPEENGVMLQVALLSFHTKQAIPLHFEAVTPANLTVPLCVLALVYGSRKAEYTADTHQNACGEHNF